MIQIISSFVFFTALSNFALAEVPIPSSGSILNSNPASASPSPSPLNSTSTSTSPIHSEIFYPAGLISKGENTPVIFAVDKTRRLLRVYDFTASRPKILAEFPSDIGKATGDKQRENDHKTPTGIYFLQKRLTQPEIPFSLYGSRAFTTDYPNIFDKRDHKGGSGIWLHAVPDSVPLTRGSRGCVVVRNDVIKKLENFINLKQTPLVIFDKLEEVAETEYDREQNQYRTFFETWRTAWEQHDVDTYIQFYDRSFKNADMNYDQWYRHKKKLKDFYKYIKVTLSEPLIIRNRGQVVIRTLQQYESDKHQDYGIKTIHAHYSKENGFKIVREDWEPRPLPLRNQASESESQTSVGLANPNSEKQN